MSRSQPGEEGVRGKSILKLVWVDHRVQRKEWQDLVPELAYLCCLAVWAPLGWTYLLNYRLTEASLFS